MTLNELRDAIDKVVDYNWDDELDDFIMNPPDHPERHILTTLVALNNFVTGTTQSVKDVADNERYVRGLD